MESKKINQLATELAPELSDLTIIGDPTTGISKKITLSQMASLFTGTVEEYASLSAFPLVGAADTIYIALDTNIIYRWNTGTSAYVELSPNIVTSLVFNDANGFDGTINLVGSTATLTITTALTTGSVGFIGASGALLEDNANFFWNNSTKRLGINTNAPTTALDVFGSGIIGRVNGTSTNNAFIGFASAGTNKWSIGNVQSDHRFRIYSEANTSELVTVLQTGQFGIGIANPTTKLHIDGGSTALIANLDADVSVAKSISFRSDNSARFNIEVSGTESGSNAGADFYIKRYSDAGAFINSPIYIGRIDGITTIETLRLYGESSGTTKTLLTLKNGYNDTSTGIRIRWDFANNAGAFLDITTDSGGSKVLGLSLSAANATPSVLLDFNALGTLRLLGTTAIKLPTGTTAERPTAENGYTRMNSTLKYPEFYDSSTSQWKPVGNFVPVEWVVVAGGGGAATNAAASRTGPSGGGGAGGYRSSVQGELSGGYDGYGEPMFAAQLGISYSVTIGAGGAIRNIGEGDGNSGSNSNFATITCRGGGGSGYPEIGSPNSGGSGGGGGENVNGAIGTLFQGFSGGNGNSTTGGGGGGATSAASGSTGGSGRSSSITGSAVTYAAGGTGGNSSSSSPGTQGAANTGNGAGGTSYNGTNNYGSAGGSGIVILKYPNTYTISTSGLTVSTVTSGNYKISSITAGTGTLIFN